MAQSTEVVIQNGHTEDILSIEFSPDDKYLLTSSKDGNAILWEVESKRQVRRFSGHTGYVNDAKFHSTKNWIATCSYDRQVIVWDMENGEIVWRFEDTGGINSIDFSKDGKYLVSGGFNVKVWDLETGAEVVDLVDRKTIFNYPGIKCVRFVPNYSRLVSLNQKGKVVLWDYSTREKLAEYYVNNDKQVDDKVNVYIGGCYDPTCLGIFLGLEDNAKMIARSQEVSGADPDKLKIQVETFIQLGDLRPNNRGITFLPNTGSYLVSDSLIKIGFADYPPNSKEQLWSSGIKSNLNGKKIKENHFASDGSVLSYLEDGKLELWERQKNNSYQRGLTINFQSGGAFGLPSCLAFGKKDPRLMATAVNSSIGLMLVSKNSEGKLGMVDLGNIQPYATPIGSAAINHGVTEIAMAPNKWDQSLRIWDLKKGKETAKLKVNRNFEETIASLSYAGHLEQLGMKGIQITIDSPKVALFKGAAEWGQVDFFVSSNDNWAQYSSINTEGGSTASAFLNEVSKSFMVVANPNIGQLMVVDYIKKEKIHDIYLPRSTGESLTCLDNNGMNVACGTYNRLNTTPDNYGGKIVWWELPDTTAKLQLTVPDSGGVYSIALPHTPDTSKLFIYAGGKKDILAYLIIKGKSPGGQVEYQTFYMPLQGHSDLVTSLAISHDDRLMASGSRDKSIIVWDISAGKPAFKYRLNIHDGGINKLQFSKDGQYLLSASVDGAVKIIQPQSGVVITTLVPLYWSYVRPDGTEESYQAHMAITPDFYYSSSSGQPNGLHFVNGLTTYGFDQFDLKYNRPDIVVKRIGKASQALIDSYEKAYQKRLEKYGFTEDMLSDDFQVPECLVENAADLPLVTEAENISLKIIAKDSVQFLDRLNVFVNNVPLYGVQGIDLRPENTKRFSTELEIPLSIGKNKIQISVLNQGGAESINTTLFITNTSPEIKPDLYLATIGVSDYQAEGKDLQFAAKDAQDIVSFYQSANGFNHVYSKSLIDGQVTKENILALRKWLEESSINDQVIIYISGHGLLDSNYDFYYATHDIDFSDPAKKGISYTEIEGLLDGIPSRKKILLMDACHTGEYDKEVNPITEEQQKTLDENSITLKAFSKGDSDNAPVLGLQNSFELMKNLFADLRKGSGATVITSSSGVQVSYENEEWANGAFTYAFLYGLKTLKSDANQDGEVSTSEIQAFLSEYVPRLTEGLQVPTFRRENLENDFRVW